MRDAWLAVGLGAVWRLDNVRHTPLLLLGVNLTGGDMAKAQPSNSPSLTEVIYDCGGPVPVARELGKAHQSVREWLVNGHLPLSEIKGRTNYSETLARMQKKGRLTAAQIKLIGIKL